MSGPIDKPTILIVEDDENLRIGLRDNLEDEGYAVSAVATGHEALDVVESQKFELLILDIMLPDIDGYSVCRQLRERNIDSRILMLTARSLEDDLVTGFEAGADDYLAKPYRLRELLMRVKALIRRRSTPVPNVVSFGELRLDRGARELAGTSGAPISLTRTEFDLLTCLLDNQGRALTRPEILDKVWGEGIVVDARTVDNFVSSLKKKLSWTRKSAWRIKTVRGVGYRMEVDE